MKGLDGGPIRIRVGIHTGQPALDPPKYIGIDIHRAARIMSAAHGGQVVLSRETADCSSAAASTSRSRRSPLQGRRHAPTDLPARTRRAPTAQVALPDRPARPRDRFPRTRDRPDRGRRASPGPRRGCSHSPAPAAPARPGSPSKPQRERGPLHRRRHLGRARAPSRSNARPSGDRARAETDRARRASRSLDDDRGCASRQAVAPPPRQRRAPPPRPCARRRKDQRLMSHAPTPRHEPRTPPADRGDDMAGARADRDRRPGAVHRTRTLRRKRVRADRRASQGSAPSSITYHSRSSSPRRAHARSPRLRSSIGSVRVWRCSRAARTTSTTVSARLPRPSPGPTTCSGPTSNAPFAP